MLVSSEITSALSHGKQDQNEIICGRKMMDRCSNINTDISYGKIVHNTSVRHSKSIARGCGCRGSVKAPRGFVRKREAI